jgi:MOSC domain-containing protein YiiM
MNAVIHSIQVGRTHVYRADDGTSWESAIGKSTIAGPVSVYCEGLEGDEQADRVHHGGPDKAILVYSSDHFAAWRQELPHWSVVGGTFGENFTWMVWLSQENASEMCTESELVDSKCHSLVIPRSGHALLCALVQ